MGHQFFGPQPQTCAHLIKLACFSVSTFRLKLVRWRASGSAAEDGINSGGAPPAVLRRFPRKVPPRFSRAVLPQGSPQVQGKTEQAKQAKQADQAKQDKQSGRTDRAGKGSRASRAGKAG